MSNKILREVRLALACSVLLVLASCGGGAQQAEQTQDTSPTPGASQTTALSDAQIAAIAVAANTVDIRNGEAAQSKTQNQAVHDFARQMVTDHTSVNQQASDLVKRLNVTPEENDISRNLMSSGDSTRAALGNMSGAAFDNAYVAAEVAFHQKVLDMLDQTLIPQASNAELKTLLQNVRPTIAAHLEHAKQIQGTLAQR